jgi:sugar lactone lactonase YvrE
MNVAQPMVAADTRDLCGEHPLWDERSATLYWTDITGRRMHRLAVDGGVELIQQGTEIAGFTMNEPGGLTVVNGQGIWLWDGASDWRLIARDSFHDCIADAEGRLLAGSIHYDPEREDYPLGRLVSVAWNGETHILDEGFRLSNGLAFSPDNRTLYFADSAARVIFAYDYNLGEGSVANRRALARFAAEAGVPDGLAMDADQGHRTAPS